MVLLGKDFGKRATHPSQFFGSTLPLWGLNTVQFAMITWLSQSDYQALYSFTSLLFPPPPSFSFSVCCFASVLSLLQNTTNILPLTKIFVCFLFHLQLKMLRVGHDNSGSNSRWLLDEVVIYSLARGERYVFKGGRWIGGRNNQIDLPLGELFSRENICSTLFYWCIFRAACTDVRESKTWRICESIPVPFSIIVIFGRVSFNLRKICSSPKQMTLNCESLFKSQVAVTISKQYLDNAFVALLAFEVENML